MERKGTVAQVLGPVVDVAFPGGMLPEINEALTVPINGKDQVMEVAQHVGGDTVRCIMLSPSEGLGRGVEVTATGHTIETPVGEETHSLDYWLSMRLPSAEKRTVRVGFSLGRGGPSSSFRWAPPTISVISWVMAACLARL